MWANQPYVTLTLASTLREVFGVKLYKSNARVLLLRVLSIVNFDWLQHAHSVSSVRGVYECAIISLQRVLLDHKLVNYISAVLLRVLHLFCPYRTLYFLFYHQKLCRWNEDFVH